MRFDPAALSKHLNTVQNYFGGRLWESDGPTTGSRRAVEAELERERQPAQDAAGGRGVLAFARRGRARGLERQEELPVRPERGQADNGEVLRDRDRELVEVGQEIALEEGADDFVHSLCGGLELDRRFSDATLDPDRVALARRGLRVVLDRRDPRQHGPAADGARFDDAMKAAHEYNGAVSEVVPEGGARRHSVSAGHVPTDDSSLDFHFRKES